MMQRKYVKKLIIIFIVLIMCGTTSFLYNILNKNDSKTFIGKEIVNISKDNSNVQNKKNIKMVNENDEEIVITEKNIEYYKILNPDTQNENIENKIIESKILSLEAKKRNIELDEENIKYIDSIINDEEVLEVIKDEEKENVQNVLEDYMKDAFYVANLKTKILEEIVEGKLSIDDEELEKLMLEYNNLQEQTKNIKDDQKQDLLKKIYNKLAEIQDLYCTKIIQQYKKNNYNF